MPRVGSLPTAAIVAVLVVLAGCGAVGPDGTETTNTEPGTTTLESAEPPYEPPLESASLLGDHVDALAGHGSYVLDRITTVNTSNSDGYRSARRVHADVDSGRVYTTDQPRPVVQVYRLGNGTAFRRVVGEDSRSYERNPPRIRTPREWARKTVESVVASVDFDHAGATTERGERVHVYRTTDPGDVSPHVLAPDAPEAEVASVNATLRVRESGLVTGVDLRYVLSMGSGERSLATTLTFEELGDADVSPPAWVDDARQATGNESG